MTSNAFYGVTKLEKLIIPETLSVIQNGGICADFSFHSQNPGSVNTTITAESSLKIVELQNRNTVLYAEALRGDFTIYGYLESTARTYATDYSMPFVSFDTPEPQIEPKPEEQSFFEKIAKFFQDIINWIKNLFS